jgi:CRP-like cAMP-binding protein
VLLKFLLAQAVNHHNANVMNVVNYLQKALTDSGERIVLSEILRKKPKKAGEFILRQGDVGSSLFFCEEGRVQFISDGNEAEFCDSGGSFGEITFLYDTPRVATCLALTDCELWMVNRDAFQYLLNRAVNLQQNRDSIEIISHSSPGQGFNTSTRF